MKYRIKPITIEAIQYTGKNYAEVLEFCKEILEDKVGSMQSIWIQSTSMSAHGKNVIVIRNALSPEEEVSPGDYIVKYEKGEFSRLKPEIFESLYEFVEE